MGELAYFKVVNKVVLPSFDKEVYKQAEINEGEEVTTLRLEEQGSHKLFVCSRRLQRKMGGRP